MTTDVKLLVRDTGRGLVLIGEATLPNLTIGPDYVDYTLPKANLSLLVRYTIAPADANASVTTVAIEVDPPDPKLLVDGPYVLALDASVDVDITCTPAAQDGQPKPKPKKLKATLRVLPPGGGDL